MSTTKPAPSASGIALSKPGIALIAFIVGGIAGWGLFALSKGDNLDVTVPLPTGGNVTFKTSDGKVAFLDLFKTLFADQTSSAATLGVLEHDYNVYAISSPSLTSAIEQLPGEDRLAKSLQLMVVNDQGPFASGKFADITSPTVVSEFDRQAQKKFYEVATALRSHCWHRQGFCEDPGTDVKILVSPGLRHGYAAACTRSGLVGAVIQIFRTGALQAVPLRVENYNQMCGDDTNVIVMNDAQALQYFGMASAPDAIKATMFVAPDGYVPDYTEPAQTLLADETRSIVPQP